MPYHTADDGNANADAHHPVAVDTADRLLDISIILDCCVNHAFTSSIGSNRLANDFLSRVEFFRNYFHTSTTFDRVIGFASGYRRSMTRHNSISLALTLAGHLELDVKRVLARAGKSRSASASGRSIDNWKSRSDQILRESQKGQAATQARWQLFHPLFRFWAPDLQENEIPSICRQFLLTCFDVVRRREASWKILDLLQVEELLRLLIAREKGSEMPFEGIRVFRERRD